MRRRDFVKRAMTTVGGAFLGVRLDKSAVLASTEAPPHRTNSKLEIQYARKQIPSFSIPPYRGQSYEDTVPDTLDIEERAKLAINALTSITDPDADYEDYFSVGFFRNPPTMRHDANDWIQICESHMECVPLLRLATGDESNSNVDPVWMKGLLKSIGPDGLMYIPLKGRPWSRNGLAEVDPVWRADGTTTTGSDESVQQVTTGEVCGKAIGLLTVYYLRDGNPMWKQTIERMIRRLSELAIERDDYAFVTGGWEPNARVRLTVEAPPDFWAEEWNGRVIEGLSQYYGASGYEPARQLAGKIARYMRLHSQNFDPDGRWMIGDAFKKAWGKSFVEYGINSHTVGGGSANHALLLLGLFEYAASANDRETMEFVRKSYEWAKNQASFCGVSSLVGWFPEMYLPGYTTCEGCTVGIMISLALKLSRSGSGDYWDDADRWVRNQFAEIQLTDIDWVHKVAAHSPSQPVALYETAKLVPERNLGAFAGWASGNDWATKYGIMNCCTGNCSRALYHVWEHMLEQEDGQLRVNLLLNRASRWADVHSYIPCEGRVDLKIKSPCKRILIRAPVWINSDSSEISCRVSGASRLPRWEGRHVDLGKAEPGEVITVTFPISERTVKERIGTADYTLVLKGNTVVSIDPPGENGPLYQRAQYRGNQASLRKVRRFVSEESVLW